MASGDGAGVVGDSVGPFDAVGIGGATATRAIMADLHAATDGVVGSSGGGPAWFHQALDRELVRLGRILGHGAVRRRSWPTQDIHYFLQGRT